MLTAILLNHWLKRHNYSSKFSTKEKIYFDIQEKGVDPRFYFDKK
jgi:hypothetical protein